MRECRVGGESGRDEGSQVSASGLRREYDPPKDS